jgi:hypothetical protein
MLIDLALLLGYQFLIVLPIFLRHFLSNPFPLLLDLWVFLIVLQSLLPLIFARP